MIRQWLKHVPLRKTPLKNISSHKEVLADESILVLCQLLGEIHRGLYMCLNADIEHPQKTLSCIKKHFFSNHILGCSFACQCCEGLLAVSSLCRQESWAKREEEIGKNGNRQCLLTSITHILGPTGPSNRELLL